MIIFAVDPGVKNMGYACYDTSKRSFITFGKWDMQTGVKSKEKTKYALLTRRFCDGMKGLLEMSDIILIEAQMQAKMKVVQTAIQCFYWEKSKVIGPLAVRKFFGIFFFNLVFIDIKIIFYVYKYWFCSSGGYSSCCCIKRIGWSYYFITFINSQSF